VDQNAESGEGHVREVEGISEGIWPMRNRECLDVLVKELEHHGIGRWRIERSRHTRLVFELNGKEFVYV